MDQVIGKPAKYITILREPASQFESLFYYEGLDTILKIKSQSRALDIFLSSPEHYYQRMRHRRKYRSSIFHLLRNGMLFDLGFSNEDNGSSRGRRSRSVRHRLHRGSSLSSSLGTPSVVNNGYTTANKQPVRGDSTTDASGVLKSSRVKDVSDRRSESTGSADTEHHRDDSATADSGFLNTRSLSNTDDQKKGYDSVESQSTSSIPKNQNNKHDSMENEQSIDNAIKSIDHDFDLVLLAEYFDESLVLLKKELCWSFDDLVYFKQNVRTRRKPISPKNAERIRNWNSGDLKLYKHFNDTLWRKIEEYGVVRFNRDLNEFRDINLRITEQCSFTMNRQDYSLTSSRTDIKRYEMRSVGDLEPSLKSICDKMLIPEAEYILRFRNKYHLNSTKVQKDDE